MESLNSGNGKGSHVNGLAHGAGKPPINGSAAAAAAPKPKRRLRKASAPGSAAGLAVRLIQPKGFTAAEAEEIKNKLEKAGVSVELTPNPNDDPLDGAGKPVTKERIRNLLDALSPYSRKKKNSAETQAEIDGMDPKHRQKMTDALSKAKPIKPGVKRGAALEKLFPDIGAHISGAKGRCSSLAKAFCQYANGLAEFRSLRAGGVVPAREFKDFGTFGAAAEHLKTAIGDLSEHLLCISQIIRRALAGADYKARRFELPMLPAILAACDRACDTTWLFVEEIMPREECAELLLDATAVVALLEQLELKD